MKLKQKAERDVDVKEPEEKKPATEPWNHENAPDSPKRQGLLGLSKSKKGYQLRWVRHDSVDRRKAQGYILATPQDFEAQPDENGMIRRNELVLMAVPDDIYDQRRKEVAERTELQTRSAKREFLAERAAASRQSGHNLATRGEDTDEE